MPMSRRTFMSLAVAAIPSALALSGFPEAVFAQTDPRATTGEWATPVTWPFISIHDMPRFCQMERYLAGEEAAMVTGMPRQTFSSGPLLRTASLKFPIRRL